MGEKDKVAQPGKIKKFFARLLDKIDKSMEEKAKSRPCCCKPAEGKGKSCCS